MHGAMLWTRSELRRRGPAMVVLAVIVGLSFGAALTAAAGARRTSTAFERFSDEARASHIRLQLGEDDLPEVLSEVRAMPEVAEAAGHAMFVAASDRTDFDVGVVASDDPALLRDIERPKILDGRLPSEDSPSEVALNEHGARALGAAVGDRVALATFTPEQLEGLVTSERWTGMSGPTLDVEVVGVVRLPDDVAESEAVMAFATPAFHARYAGVAGGFLGNAAIRLHDSSHTSRVLEGIRSLPVEGLEVSDQRATRDKVRTSTGVLAAGLLAFAVCAGLAALVIAAQAVSRLLALSSGDQHQLASLGLTRRERWAGLLAVAVPTALAGAVLAVLVAIAASPLMPIGLARTAEPSPGVDVDAAALGAGALLVIAAVLVPSGLAARSVARRVGRHAVQETGTLRRSAITQSAARAGAPPAAVVGAGMALEAGRGRTAVPVRPALAGVALGVAGLVAALSVDASLQQLVSSPERYGWAWDVAPDYETGRFHELAALDEVGDLADLAYAAVALEGDEVQGAALEDLQGSTSFRVEAGRMPATPGEVAVGPADADRLGLSLGETVQVGGGDRARDLTVVGEVLFPSMDDRPMASGVLLHPELLPEVAHTDGFHRPLITWAQGVDHEAALRRLEEAFPEAMSAYALPTPPSEIANLAAVDGVPRALAVFLALLALAAAGHALVTTVRRRRADLAILRTLGMDRRQVRSAVLWQGGTLALIGTVVGLPLGVALGRTVWRVISEDVGVPPAPVVPALTVALTGALAIAALVALAVGPARAAVRIRPADALRTE